LTSDSPLGIGSAIAAGVAWLALLLMPQPSFSQTVTDIYNFTGNNGSGVPLYVTPMQGRNGQFFGTTGGEGGTNYGTIFQLSTRGVLKQLYTFDDTSGSQPSGGLTLATDGNLYGTASLGGSAGLGVLFKMSPSGTYTVLYNFTGGSDGAAPASPPIVGFDGNLYGTTYGNSTTVSTVYKYTRSSGLFTTIYQFSQSEGATVVASLVQGTDGNLYGTAYQGGGAGCGAIFELSTSGTLLWDYSFPCQPGGANPIAGLIQASDGSFYGTTLTGGTYNVGTVFKVSQGVVSTVYNFHGFPVTATSKDGSYPYGGLVQATDGNLYGSTGGGGGPDGGGTLFEISTGGYKQLYIFAKKNGQSPFGTLLQDTSGVFYGTTFEGGKYNEGVVYSLNMGLGPFVALVSYAGEVGSTAQILGQGLTGTTAVTFNGVPATSFNVVSSTFTTAVVPSGATTGPVVVTTPSGALTSNKNFEIIPSSASAAGTQSARPITRAPKKTSTQ
ncbi:MAG: choice-of-anchor tandem repeat GloVer-containing protein, partial [Candidatus Sulfotelmatobacter sp.]